MTILAPLSITEVLEAAIASLRIDSISVPAEYWEGKPYQFRAFEGYLEDRFPVSETVNFIKLAFKLESELDGGNLLFIYILLTRQAHEHAVIYEWKDPYTCRQLGRIPTYFGSLYTPLNMLYGDAKNGHTPAKDRITEFDKKCAEYALILGMTPKQGGHSV